MQKHHKIKMVNKTISPDVIYVDKRTNKVYYQNEWDLMAPYPIDPEDYNSTDYEYIAESKLFLIYQIKNNGNNGIST